MFRVLTFLLWLLVAAATLSVASFPLGVEAQLALAVGALAAMLALKIFNLEAPSAASSSALGTFVILRYLFWRLSSTVPPISSPADFAVGAVLLIAEIYCIAMMFLSLFTVADPIERPKAPRVSDEDAPTVDVFVPTYNESYRNRRADVGGGQANELSRGQAQRLPARRWLDRGEAAVGRSGDGAAGAESARKLPDAVRGARRPLPLPRRKQARQSGQPQLRPREQPGRAGGGVRRRSRARAGLSHRDRRLLRPGRKAVSGSDAAFLPQRDPIERNIGAVGMPAENEMFYGLVQKGLDKWNAAFFCGSAALLRAPGAREVGGFHGSSVTEDAETALELHAHGWNSVYVQSR